MTIRMALACMALGIILTACAKDSNPTGPDNPGFSNPYFPLTTGSTWTYALEQPGRAPFEYTATVDGDTTMDGRTYVRLRTDLSSGNGYARVESNGDVYSVTGSGSLELKVLKGNPKNGETWSLDRNVGGTMNYYTYTIGNADTTCTVRGRTYTNVVRVEMADSVIVLGMKYPVDTGRYFFAKGVGLVQSRFDRLATTVDLISYSVK